MGPGHTGGNPPAGECLGDRGCPVVAHSSACAADRSHHHQDLENPMDVPLGWLRHVPSRDLAELSGDEDEAPWVTEGTRSPGRAGD